MSLTPITFLQQAALAKNKNKIDLNHLYELLSSDHPHLVKINDRGLYVLLLSEILWKKILAYGVTLNKFIKDLNDRQQKQKTRKTRNRETGVQRPRKNKKNKKKSQAALNELQNLQAISDQSLSNPSNVQAPRINQATRLRNDEASNGVKSSSENDSKNAKNKEDDKFIQFNNGLNKISQDIREMGQTTFDYPEGNDYNFQQMIPNEDSSSNSQQSFGMINNLTQKMKIFMTDTENVARGTETKRKTRRKRNTTTTVTKKKRPEQIMDDSTTIIEGKTLGNLTMLNNLNESKIFMENRELIEKYRDFMPRINNQQINSIQRDFFQQENLGQIKKLNLQLNVPSQNIDADFQPNMFPKMEYSSPFEDFSYHHVEYNPERQYDHKIDLQQKSISLTEFAIKEKRKKASVFYQLLWRCQNDEVELQQKQPLSQIMITII